MILIGCFKTGKVGPVRVPLRTGTSRTTPGGHRAGISVSALVWTSGVQISWPFQLLMKRAALSAQVNLRHVLFYYYSVR